MLRSPLPRAKKQLHGAFANIAPSRCPIADPGQGRGAAADPAGSLQTEVTPGYFWASSLLQVVGFEYRNIVGWCTGTWWVGA